MFAAYFFIALFATTIGALTGMGGGVIIKPVLDLLGSFSAPTINVLSCLTVFFMAISSVLRQIKGRVDVNLGDAVSMGLGGVVGGIAGQGAVSMVAKMLGSQKITLTQNVMLAITILIVYYYMKNQERLKSLNIVRWYIPVLVGLGLGLISSFLGIGGGSMNVALILFILGGTMKSARVYSLIIILFSQTAKIVSIWLETGFGIYDLSIAPVMISGAVLGGMLGARLSKALSEDQSKRYFNYVQVLVLLICISNIVKIVI